MLNSSDYLNARAQEIALSDELHILISDIQRYVKTQLGLAHKSILISNVKKGHDGHTYFIIELNHEFILVNVYENLSLTTKFTFLFDDFSLMKNDHPVSLQEFNVFYHLLHEGLDKVSDGTADLYKERT